MELHATLITNDAVVLGILMGLLGLIFYTSNLKGGGAEKFYKVIPALLLCYFLPSIFTSLGIIAPYWHDLAAIADHVAGLGYALPEAYTKADLEQGIAQLGLQKEDLDAFVVKSKLYFVASRYCLPAALVLLTLSISLKELAKLGFKPVAMFLTGTVGVMIGGPLAILACSAIAPEVVGGAGPEAVWRGMSTVAGSWIGGGANQAAMYEVFQPSGKLYSIMITVDVIVAEVWMAFLLFGVGKSEQIDRWLKADSSSVETLKNKMHEFSQKIARNPSMADMIIILAFSAYLARKAEFNKESSTGWVLECFDPVANYNKIFSKTQRRNPNWDLEFFDIIRGFSTLIVIYGHEYFLRMASTTNLGYELKNGFFDSLTFGFLYFCLYSVDIFFFLSGFFLSFSTIPKMLSRNKPIDFLKTILNRYLRLVPLYFFMICCYWQLVTHLGEGPKW